MTLQPGPTRIDSRVLDAGWPRQHADTERGGDTGGPRVWPWNGVLHAALNATSARARAARGSGFGPSEASAHYCSPAAAPRGCATRRETPQQRGSRCSTAAAPVAAGAAPQRRTCWWTCWVEGLLDLLGGGPVEDVARGEQHLVGELAALRRRRGASRGGSGA